MIYRALGHLARYGPLWLWRALPERIRRWWGREWMRRFLAGREPHG